MRHFALAFGVAVLAAFPTVSAMAFREPKSIASPSGGGMGLVAIVLVIGLIVGVSMMSPRRTHQD